MHTFDPCDGWSLVYSINKLLPTSISKLSLWMKYNEIDNSQNTSWKLQDSFFQWVKAKYVDVPFHTRLAWITVAMKIILIPGKVYLKQNKSNINPLVDMFCSCIHTVELSYILHVFVCHIQLLLLFNSAVFEYLNSQSLMWLTEGGRITNVCVSKIAHHWFRWSPRAYLELGHYLNQC